MFSWDICEIFKNTYFQEHLRMSASEEIADSLTFTEKVIRAKLYFMCSLSFKIHIHTAQKMKFSIKDFFSKCDQIRSSSPAKWNYQGFNSFQGNVPFLYRLKTSEMLRFFDIFRRYKNGILVWNGIIKEYLWHYTFADDIL